MASDMSGETGTAISLRPCVKGDEQALALVGQATFLEAFAGILDGADVIAHCQRQHDAQLYRDWLALPAMRLWLAEATPGGAPVGYLVLSPASLPVPDPRPDDLEIKRIYLLHRFQGQRVGQRLMQAALAQARASGQGACCWACTRKTATRWPSMRAAALRSWGGTFRVGRTDYQDVILGIGL
jgi:GNAT superfamily N-acetyltransferase